MEAPNTITLRDATAADLPFLSSLFFASHRDDFAPLGLDPAKLDALLHMQAKAQSADYAQRYPNAQDRIILLDSSPVGHFLVEEQPDALHLLDIALLPPSRNKGVGTQVLQDLIRQSELRNVPLSLSVQTSNRALHLYTRLGFQIAEPLEPASMTHMKMVYRPGSPSEAISPANVSLDSNQDETLSGWSSQVGGNFFIDVPQHEHPLSLTLVRLHRTDPTASRPFSLFFHGSRNQPLPQGTYLLTPELPPRSDQFVFLVPLGEERGNMLYEAVFN